MEDRMSCGKPIFQAVGNLTATPMKAFMHKLKRRLTRELHSLGLYSETCIPEGYA